MRARLHDQVPGPLVTDAGGLDQLVDRQLGQFLARVHAGIGQLAGQLAVHALERQQVVGGGADLLLGRDRLGQQRVARTVAQFVDRLFVEGLDLEHLVDRHVRDLLDGR